MVEEKNLPSSSNQHIKTTINNITTNNSQKVIIRNPKANNNIMNKIVSRFNHNRNRTR